MTSGVIKRWGILFRADSFDRRDGNRINGGDKKIVMLSMLNIRVPHVVSSK